MGLPELSRFRDKLGRFLGIDGLKQQVISSDELGSLYECWKDLTAEEKIQFVRGIPIQTTAFVISLMMGEPGETVQIQNKYKADILGHVLRFNPSALAIEIEEGLPTWIDVVARLNFGEDEEVDEAIEQIRMKYYGDLYDLPNFRKAESNISKRREELIRRFRSNNDRT